MRGFLDKNKDVQQEQLFDFLEQSTRPFSREISKFRVQRREEGGREGGREGGTDTKKRFDVFLFGNCYSTGYVDNLLGNCKEESNQIKEPNHWN